MVRISYQEIDPSYEQIKRSACGRTACSVMIIVANEIDAMSTARMLTQLLRADNIAYTIKPVSNFSQVVQNYRSYVTPEIKTVIMINCGAMHNIPRLFGLERGGETRCFIFDNHRPFHLANIHSRYNVVVFDDDIEIARDITEGFIPSDASDLSAASDNDSSDEDEEEEEDDDDQEEQDDENVFSDEEEEEFREEADEAEEAEEAEEGEEEEEGEEVENDAAENEEDDDGGEEDIDGGEEDVDKENRRTRDENVDEDVDDSASPKRSKTSSKRRRKGVVDGDGYEAGGEGVETAEDDEGEVEGEGEDPYAGEAVEAEAAMQRNEEEDEEEDEQVRVVGKRRRALERLHDPAKIRKQRLRSYYYQGAWYSYPTSLMMINLVWGRRGSHVPLDLIWQTVLGVTDQYQRARIDDSTYSQVCENIHRLLGEHLTSAPERARYKVGEGEEEVMAQGAETGHIQEVAEFRFFLHRHWSLFDAMYHSQYIASKMPVWQAQGTARLQELLAKMGMPLDQCRRQSYNTIRADLRTHFRRQLLDESVQQDYSLKNPDVMYRSFSRYNSFKNPVGALDVVFAATSLLELCSADDASPQGNENNAAAATSSNPSRQRAFNEAYDCLGTGAKAEDLLRKGVQTALSLQKAIVKKASVMLDGYDSIFKLTRLYFAYAHRTSFTGMGAGAEAMSLSAAMGGANSLASSGAAESELDAPFTRPHVLSRLGQFVMEVKRNLSKRQGGWVGRKNLLPLILVAEKRDSFLLVGISPLNSSQGAEGLSQEDEMILRNLSNFRQYYRLAFKEIQSEPLYESFDSNIIEVRKGDVQDFIGTVDYLMKKATQDQFQSKN